MAKQDNDDLAAALHKLHSGAADSTASEHADDIHSQEPQVREPAPQSPPVKPKPAPAKPTSPKPARPASPTAPAAAAKPRPTQPVQAAPKRPAAPSAPPPRSSAPPPAASSSRVRPASPTAPPTISEEAFEHVEDDDRGADEEAAIAATQALDYHGPRTAPTKSKRVPYYKMLGFRRTAIPVAMTLGAMMLIAVAARFFVDEEAPLRRVPMWANAILVALGLLSIGVSVLNMLTVRNELARRAQRSS